MYYKALDAIYSVNASIEYYLLTNDNTRQIITLNKNPVGSSRGQNPDTHGLLDEIQKKSLGDYWRVLRTRPANNATKAKNPDIEYIPNIRIRIIWSRKPLNRNIIRTSKFDHPDTGMKLLRRTSQTTCSTH
jgi:hypothetical protein